VGTSPQFAAAGDLNRDAKLDLVVANRSSNTVTILLGNGLGGFSQAPGSPIATGFSQAQSVAIADVNGDGKLDFAVANEGSNNAAVYLGNGLGGFGRAASSPVGTGIGPHVVRIADLNGDSRMDLVTANDTGASLTIDLNTTSFAPDGTACDDRNACSGPDTCQTGACTGSPVADGTVCNDNNGCTLADSCQAGTCTSTGVVRRNGRVRSGRGGYRRTLGSERIERDDQLASRRGGDLVGDPPRPSVRVARRSGRRRRDLSRHERAEHDADLFGREPSADRRRLLVPGAWRQRMREGILRIPSHGRSADGGEVDHELSVDGFDRTRRSFLEHSRSSC
jgi:hypothetical protein